MISDNAVPSLTLLSTIYTIQQVVIVVTKHKLIQLAGVSSDTYFTDSSQLILQIFDSTVLRVQYILK